MKPVTATDRLGRPGGWLLATATLSRLADEAAGVAVVLVVIARTGDPRLAGLVLSAFALPTLVTGPVLGAVLDRVRSKRPLFVANQVVLAVALGGILSLAGRAPGTVLIGLGLLAGLTAPVLTGGYSAIVPLVVPRGGLRRANAADAASYNVAGLGGPALVAAVAGAAGADVALAGTAALAALGIVLVLRAPMPGRARPMVPDGPVESLPVAFRAGLRLLVRQPLLRATTLATTTSYASLGLLPVTVPLLAIHLGRPAAYGGWLLTALGGGALVGTLTSARLLAVLRPTTLMTIAFAGFGALLAGVAMAASLSTAIALVALAGVASGPVLAATLAVRQQCVPADRYAQVVATAASLKIGGYALGAAAGGLLATHLTAPRLLLVVAAGQLVAVALVAVRRPGPPPRDPLPMARPDGKHPEHDGRAGARPVTERAG
ncbi:MFS transporter [Plantactinospora sp. GCM10030261]|uniref:MFS transporter n=1 Tax=Plantactinospora sp. GCM10030261 TaxID=3273420 RepID=UPI00361D4F6A